MTVRRLLTEMDSYELSCWQAFLAADADYRSEQHRRAQEDARIEAGLP